MPSPVTTVELLNPSFVVHVAPPAGPERVVGIAHVNAADRTDDLVTADSARGAALAQTAHDGRVGRKPGIGGRVTKDDEPTGRMNGLLHNFLPSHIDTGSHSIHKDESVSHLPDHRIAAVVRQRGLQFASASGAGERPLQALLGALARVSLRPITRSRW